MSVNVRSEIPYPHIAACCRRHSIRRLALSGSVLREDFRPDSDVDVLVQFEPGHTPDLAFLGMQAELSALLGRKIDGYDAVDYDILGQILTDDLPTLIAALEPLVPPPPPDEP